MHSSRRYCPALYSYNFFPSNMSPFSISFPFARMLDHFFLSLSYFLFILNSKASQIHSSQNFRLNFSSQNHLHVHLSCSLTFEVHVTNIFLSMIDLFFHYTIEQTKRKLRTVL